MNDRHKSRYRRLERHFVTCSTLTGAAFALSGQEAAEAAIIYMDPTNIAVPQTTAGVYINLETGVNAITPAAAPGWDINPFGSTILAMFADNNALGSQIAATAATGGQFVAVAPLTDLSTLTYDPSNFNLQATPEIRAGGTFFIAMVFQDAAAVNHRAWIEITTAAPSGQPATVNRWAYQPVADGAFLAGQIPEPGTAALGLLAAGAVGLRRRRRAA